MQDSNGGDRSGCGLSQQAVVPRASVLLPTATSWRGCKESPVAGAGGAAAWEAWPQSPPQVICRRPTALGPPRQHKSGHVVRNDEKTSLLRILSSVHEGARALGTSSLARALFAAHRRPLPPVPPRATAVAVAERASVLALYGSPPPWKRALSSRPGVVGAACRCSRHGRGRLPMLPAVAAAAVVPWKRGGRGRRHWRRQPAAARHWRGRRQGTRCAEAEHPNEAT